CWLLLRPWPNSCKRGSVWAYTAALSPRPFLVVEPSVNRPTSSIWIGARRCAPVARPRPCLQTRGARPCRCSSDSMRDPSSRIGHGAAAVTTATHRRQIVGGDDQGENDRGASLWLLALDLVSRLGSWAPRGATRHTDRQAFARFICCAVDTGPPPSILVP